MTQLDKITDTVARLEEQTDISSSPPSQKNEDDHDLTEKPEVRRPPQSTRQAASKRSRTKPTSKKSRPKKVVLMGLLGRKSGATMQAMMDATGWQAHSLRSALSGLRKGGTNIERRANRKGESVYAIVVADQA